MSKIPQDVSASCFECKHLQSEENEEPLRCAAFPRGIPIWISHIDDSHFVPRDGDHGIQFEPSDEFLKWLEEGRWQIVPDPDYRSWTEEEIEEAARITNADITRALELTFEASPELAKLVVEGFEFKIGDDEDGSHTQ